MISIKQMFIFIDVNYLEKHASMTNKVEGLQQLKRVKTLDITCSPLFFKNALVFQKYENNNYFTNNKFCL
jgi:hypothetical protein